MIQDHLKEQTTQLWMIFTQAAVYAECVNQIKIIAKIH